MTNPSVSVVLLNWNSGELGSKAAKSVRRQSVSDIELIVVDNASHDQSLATIEEASTPEIVSRQPTNTGFAAGMNIGVELSSAPFVLLLNCDAELEEHYVASTLDVLRSHPEAAVAGGRVTSPHTGDTGPFSMSATMRTRPLSTEAPMRCEKVDASCPVHRRAAIETVRSAFGVAPFDPSYDTYGEDLDLAHKYRRLGWTLRYTPEAKATHVRSFSSAHRLRHKRGRLRVNNLANRHRNLLRHGQLAWWPRMIAEDVAFAALGPLSRDWAVFGDVATSWRRVAGNAGDDLRLRRSVTEVGRALDER